MARLRERDQWLDGKWNGTLICDPDAPGAKWARPAASTMQRATSSDSPVFEVTVAVATSPLGAIFKRRKSLPSFGSDAARCS